MACAAQIPAHQIADKGPGTEEMTEAERELLQQPFALAVQEMGFERLDLILYAAKLLQSQKRPLQAPSVMLEAEDLLERERQGKKFPPLAQKPREMDNYHNYGSDGESDKDSNEESSDKYYDADDIQTDSAEPEPVSRAAVITPENQPHVHETSRAKEPKIQQVLTTSPSRSKAAEMQPQLSEIEESPREPKRKLDSGKDLQSLKLKLQVLRSENKRLKERQLCRDCHSKPVSITFLPCGHYSYCYDCGQRFSACPICRKTILADVRTFLA